MTELLYHPLAGIFPLLSGVDFEALVADVRQHGVREPVVLHDGMILDGRNRHRASVLAGVDCPLAIFDGNDPVSFVVSLNLRRRHLDESQRAMVAAKLANMPAHRPLDKSANLHTSQETAAHLLNVSKRSVASAAKVRDDGTTELQHAVEQGQVRVSTAADIARLPQDEQREVVARGEREILAKAKEIRAGKAEERRTERIANLVEISKGNVEFPTERRYPIIYADPPWRYENPPMGGSNRSIENHYPTMSLDEICALPVARVAADDALLYLWATAPKLAECMEVISAWGFVYRTNFVWVKDKIGMGYHARNQHEILLVSKRGEIPPPAVADRVSSVVYAPRGEHSEKPDEFYELIESFYPTLPKIELFSRPPLREGWAVWGNQAVAA